MAVRPEPLVDGLVSLAPPARREHVRHVLDRVRQSWIGWMEGVAIDMLITGVFTYVALTIIGLDFAIFFAVLSSLLVVVPYFGAIAGAVPPVLFALTDSPGKALLVLGAYILVQQLESNVTMPVIMSQRVRMHPAMIAIGVVVVGRLFGFVGLFVAVPILSLITICVQEFWVKELDELDRDRRRPDIALPTGADEVSAAREPAHPELVEDEERSDQLRDRDHHPDRHEHDDQDLDHDPEARELAHSMRAWRRAIATACTRVSASSFWMARLVSDFTVSALRPMRVATCWVWKPAGQQLQDLALALGQRGVGAHLRHQQGRRERRVHERLAGRHRAHGPQQILRRRPLQHVPVARRRRWRRRGGACRRRRRTRPIFTSGAACEIRLTAEMPSIPGRRTSTITTSGLQPLDGLHDLLARLDAADQLEVVGLAEHEAETLAHGRMVVHREALRGRGHRRHSLMTVGTAVGNRHMMRRGPRKERTCSDLWS